MKEMNYLTKMAILLLSVLLAQGCTNTTFNLDDYDEYIKSTNSEMITYHKDGAIRTRMPFKKGVKDGTAYSYYSDGVKRSALIYKDNKLNGVQRAWHNNGVLKSEEPVKNGVRHGYLKSYYESGAKREVVLYEGGEPIDINMYHEDGSVLYEKNYRKTKD